MQKIKGFLMGLAVATMLSTSIQAQEATTEATFAGSAAVDFSNNYYFRGGYLFEEGTFSAFPSVTLELPKQSLSLNIWAAVPFMNRSKPLTSVGKEEIDFTLNYELAINDKLTLNFGGILYTGFFADPESWNTEEIYVTASYAFTDAFSLGTGIYADLDAYKGVFWTITPTYTTSLADKLSLTANAIFSLSKYDGADLAIIETGAKGAVSYALTDAAALNASLLYNYNIDAEKHLYCMLLGASMSW